MSRNISYDESTEFTCLHDIQHRDYDENADNVDMDSDGIDQRKSLDTMTEPQSDDISMTHSSTSTTVQTTSNNAQPLNVRKCTHSKSEIKHFKIAF